MPKNAEVKIQFLTSGSSKIKKTLGSLTGAVTNLARIGAQQLGRFFKDSIELGKEFEMAITQVGVTAGASGKEIDLLAEAAKKAGESTMFTATESAGALNQLASAGFGVKGSIELLDSTLRLAVGGNVRLEKASKVVTAALKGFGVESENAEGMLDKLLVTTQVSSLKMKEMDAVLGKLSAKAVAFQGHIDGFVGKTLAMSGALKDSGISAGKAGTDVARLIERFGAAGKKEDIIARIFGDPKALFDSEGKMKDILDIVDMFDEKFKGFKNAEQVMTDITSTFSGLKSNLSAVLPTTEKALETTKTLYSKQPEKLEKIITEFNNTSSDLQHQFLLDTLKKSKETENALRSLGTESAIGFVGNLFEEGSEASERFFNTLGKYADSDIFSTMKDLLGTKGLSTFLTIVNQGTDQIRQNADKINKASGELKEAEKKFNETLKGQIALFQSAWQGFQLRVSDKLQAGLKSSIGGFRKLLFGEDKEIEIPIDANLSGVESGITTMKKTIHEKGLLDLIDLEAFGNSIKQVTNTILNLFTTISNLFSELDISIDFSYIIEQINWLINTIGNILKPVFKEMSPVLAELQNALKEVWENLKPIIERVLEFVGKILPSLTKVLTPITKIIGTILKPIGEIIDLLLTYLEPIIIPIIENLSVIFDELGKVLEPIFKTIGGIVKLLIGIATLNFDMMAEGLGETMNGIKDTTTGTFEAIGNIISDSLNRVNTYIKDTFGIDVKGFFTELGTSISNIFNNIVTSIQTFFTPIVEWINTNIIIPITSFFTNFWNSLTTGLTKFWTDLQLIWGQITGWINTNIIEPIKKDWESFSSSVSEVFNTAWTKIKEVWNGVTTWLNENIFTPISETAKNIWNDITGALGSLFGEAIEGVKADFGAFFSWLGQAFGKIVAKIGKILQDIANNPVFNVISTILTGGVNQVINAATNAMSGGGGGNMPGVSPMAQSGMAMGGIVNGPSSPIDSIPSMLTGGEFVVNADSTRKFLPILEQINRGNYAKFADGGKVEVPSFNNKNDSIFNNNNSSNKNVNMNIGNITVNGVSKDIDAYELASKIKDEIAEELNLLIV